MPLIKCFAFWLPILAIVNYIYELIFHPIKDIVLAIDPLLGFLFNVFDGVVYENYNILFLGFLLHFFLWFVYGVILDCIVKKLGSDKRKVYRLRR